MGKTYYDHFGSRHQPGFPHFVAEAWWIPSTDDHPWDFSYARLPLSEALYQSLFQLRIMDRFYELPYSGMLGMAEEGVLTSACLAPAAVAVREIAGTLSSGSYDWCCATPISPEYHEYRIIASREQLKKELIEFADFIEEADHRGHLVQLWL